MSATGSDTLHRAHKVLEYLITKTVLDGSSRSSTLRIPYSELMVAMGRIIEHKDYDTTDLVIEMKLSWDGGGESLLSMDEDDINEYLGE